MVTFDNPTPDDVRAVILGDASEYPDAEVQPFIDDAVNLVENQIAPAASSTDSTALEIVAKYVAAAYTTGGPGTPGVVTRVAQGDASMSWASAQLADATVDYFERAIVHDPTGQLGRPSLSFSVR